MGLQQNIRLELVETFPLSPTVRKLVFDPSEPISFSAGQWLKLQLQPGFSRDYSIASPPNISQIEILVTLAGEGSQQLHEADVGTTYEASLPHGYFTKEPGPGCFIGTGTGLAPLRSMILHALTHEPETKLHLLHGVRHEHEMLFESEWNMLRTLHPNFSFEYCLSQPLGTWNAKSGYVQQHINTMVQHASSGHQPDMHYYICGLQDMVRAVRAELKFCGIERQWVHSERFT